MRKVLPYIFGLIIVISIGAYLQWKFCCEHPIDKGMYIEDADGNVIVKIEDDFRFQQNSSKFEKPIPSSLSMAIDQIKQYLSTHTDNALIITGLFSDSETATIGINRAKTVCNYLNKEGVDPTQLITKKELDLSMDLNDNLYESALVYHIGDAIKVDFGTINLVDDRTGIQINSDENFTFKKNNFEFDQPVNKNLKNDFARLKDFLEKEEDKVLRIQGYYRDEEKNNSIYPNLGIARAVTIKEFLINEGIPSNKIEIKGEKTNYLNQYSKVYKNPLSFTLESRDENSRTTLLNNYYSFRDEIKKRPITLYFEVGDDSIQIGDQQRNRILKLTEYLDFVDGSKAVVTGHTSNKGLWKENLVLGRERANFLKEYLMNNGIAEDKIITRSKGEGSPITSNLTEEGRTKNRRVELTLK